MERVRSWAAAEIEAVRQEHGQAFRGLERRVARLESRNGTATASGGDGRRARPADGPKAAGRQPMAKPLERRKYPELVMWEPAPYTVSSSGAAWPLVEEWRRLRAGLGAGGRGLAWVIVEKRVLELKVGMLEEHGLTLPPEPEPVRGIWRESRQRWRERARRERMRRLRRVLPMGLWWE